VSPNKRKDATEIVPKKKVKHDPLLSHEKISVSMLRNESSRRIRGPKQVEVKEPPSLSKDPMWDWDPKPSVMQQIKLFFKSPSPVMIAGPNVDNALYGALMEFRLREVLGAEVGGELKDLIAYDSNLNAPVERAMYMFEQAKNYEDPIAIANFRQWGKFAEQFERLWDGPLRDLYDVS
jgi:hypothetical protein